MKIGLFPLVGDLLHPGHLLALKEAKNNCDYLIIAMNVDPTFDNPNKQKPIETVYERFIRLRCCKYVDDILPYAGEADLLNLLKTTKYDVRFVGADHKDGYTGDEYEKAHKIEQYIIEREHNLSSTLLRSKIRGERK